MRPGRSGARDDLWEATGRRSPRDRNGRADQERPGEDTAGPVRSGRLGDRRSGLEREEPEEREGTAAAWEREAPPRRGRRVDAALAARLAARRVAEMTGREPEGVTSLERADDGRWRVGVEVVEIHRIPDTTDILALYETELDDDGELISYRRTRRDARAQVLEE
jgi:hypothetical protein